MSIGDTIRGAFGGSKPPLTLEEQELLSRCVFTVQQGLVAFSKVGGALKVIRAKQLYRATHDTFESYCESTFGLTARRCQQLIEASEVVEQMKLASPVAPLPATAKAAAALAGLQPQQAIEAFTEARATAAPAEPTASQIKEAADKHRTAKGKKRVRAAKPIRLKVPGATVIIVPNKKAWTGDISAALTAAIDRVHASASSAAA